jgi:hypothetical protein
MKAFQKARTQYLKLFEPSQTLPSKGGPQGLHPLDTRNWTNAGGGQVPTSCVRVGALHPCRIRWKPVIDLNLNNVGGSVMLGAKFEKEFAIPV